MSDSFLKKYINNLDEDAEKDFEKGDDKDGRDDYDKVGRLHDLLAEHLPKISESLAKIASHYEIKKVESDRDESKLKEGEKEQKGEKEND